MGATRLVTHLNEMDAMRVLPVDCSRFRGNLKLIEKKQSAVSVIRKIIR